MMKVKLIALFISVVLMLVYVAVIYLLATYTESEFLAIFVIGILSFITWIAIEILAQYLMQKSRVK